MSNLNRAIKLYSEAIEVPKGVTITPEVIDRLNVIANDIIKEVEGIEKGGDNEVD